MNTVHETVFSAGRGLRRLLFAPRCLLCAELDASDGALCAQCMSLLPWQRGACRRCALPLADVGAAICGACLRHPPVLDAVDAVFSYDWPVDVLLRGFKFDQDLAAGRMFAMLMAERCSTLARPQALLPVMLHDGRLRQRGYDQALELARPLARALHLPCLAIVQRQRATAAQSTLDARERRRNLRGAFMVSAAVPEHVALLDDVMTTGATLNAAALALRRAGAQRIDAWVCARVA